MKFLSRFIVIVSLVWPLSLAETAIPDRPIFEYEGDGQLVFLNTHTYEQLEIKYKDKKGRYLEDGLEEIDYILRCRLTDEIIPIDQKLIALVDHIQDHFGADTIEVISGYRSVELNGLLRRRGRGVARHSLHMVGQAIDIRIPGVPTREIRDYAISLAVGGVGYYRGPDFVHLDVGQVRHW